MLIMLRVGRWVVCVVALTLMLSGCNSAVDIPSGGPRIDVTEFTTCRLAQHCVEVTLVNQGNKRSGDVTVIARWFDLSKTVAEDRQTLPGLAPGEEVTVVLMSDKVGVTSHYVIIVTHDDLVITVIP